MPAPRPQPIVERVFHKLGGRQALGTEVSSEADLARIVHGGIRLRVLDHVERAGFSKQEIERFIIPARTWRHRKIKQEPLTIEESDRVIRLTRLQSMAEDCSATLEKPTGGFAKAWEFLMARRLSNLPGPSPARA